MSDASGFYWSLGAEQHIVKVALGIKPQDCVTLLFITYLICKERCTHLGFFYVEQRRKIQKKVFLHPGFLPMNKPISDAVFLSSILLSTNSKTEERIKPPSCCCAVCVHSSC